MGYSRFVEIGRVCLVNYGPLNNSLVVVVDVVDGRRALVDGPGVKRQMVSFKRLSLTNLKVEGFVHSATAKIVKKQWEACEIEKKWTESTWAKKLAQREARANTTDFQRFQVMINRKKRSQIINKELAKMKKSA
ncbi:hypothetical protein SARC_03269 [Sphaeroforma arctica JP610]|uniref:Large ribosomal subunit protein eL14 domain-containing protein n=1 Tax=Sphaeroforma arctica JP610 TaxID=667725 RepID=A0A0L0G8F6_9EUKA|nr:hypothetical protein SARC_03269 [Sphaeroforma arctica JP610]KNC84523.1 hypothetical protein SARC_03269 [Sphaeroforma arctica JP610]|eukprot:XP_014158425.1 hypothetical protein SARC_03269 [Sphaeroforma arctica JP610]